jgi:hypothetical protein
MTKLNGWKRVGIIASFVWVLGAGVHTYSSDIDEASKFIVSTHIACDRNLINVPESDWDKAFDRCNKDADDSLALAITDARLEAALVAFVPVPLGWAFAYLVLFLARWVKRGFMRPL